MDFDYSQQLTMPDQSVTPYRGVLVDNYSFQVDVSYKKTERISGNFIFSPVPRFDVGMKVIWGRRTNDVNEGEDAIQTQISAHCRFQ
jgi:hypothetical protein